MIKRLLSFLLLSTVFLGVGSLGGSSFVTASSLKEGLNANLRASGNQGGFNENTKISTIIGTVIKTFLGLLGVVFIIMIVWAGFEWMQAQGEDSKIADAQKMITNSIIGLIIVMAAYSITLFVLKAIQDATNTLKTQ